MLKNLLIFPKKKLSRFSVYFIEIFKKIFKTKTIQFFPRKLVILTEEKTNEKTNRSIRKMINRKTPKESAMISDVCVGVYCVISLEIFEIQKEITRFFFLLVIY